MNIPLSRRLQICAGFISPGDRVADIGCDHGYLSIYLLKNGIASHVYASDINEGPLQSALRNAHKFGVADRLQLFLSDGVRNIPRDFDTLVCAGMGGDTMVHILQSAPWLRSKQYRLILQCQSKTPLLRRYLSEQGWRITEESAIKDGRFIYTVMEVYWEPEYPRLSIGQWYFPPALLENPGVDTIGYFKYVVEGLRIATAHKEDAEKQQALQELLTIANDPALDFLKEAIL
jgi:tRNA (adenine22-N1)-methyltransferase